MEGLGVDMLPLQAGLPLLVAGTARISFVFWTHEPCQSVCFEADCGNAIEAQGMSPQSAIGSETRHVG